MSRRVPDIGKLQQLTGYKPRVDLDEILERVIDYWSPELPPLESRAEAPFWHEPGELFVH
jgi:hypothetical protein